MAQLCWLDTSATKPTMTPTLELNNGVTIPTLGLGVFQSPPAQTVTAVEARFLRVTDRSTRLPPMATSGGVSATSGRSARASGARVEASVVSQLWG